MLTGLGRVVVAAAGTPVQLTTQQLGTRVQRVRIQAEHDNTGRIYVGLAGMVVATGVNVLGVVGIPAASGEIPAFDIGAAGLPTGVSLSDLWLDASVSGDGAYVCWV